MTTSAATPKAATARRLDDIRLTDAAEVGAKAASLGELIASGVRVPPGVVLPVGAAELTADDRTSLLLDGVAELGNGPFAVRSSGIAEDGAEHSYAGIYESILDVRADGLAAATERVLASASDSRAAVYGAGRASRERLAVIVQRMIQPAAAGVALTADPISGDRSLSVVTAVRGTGDRLVSGASIGDEWAVRDGRATARRRPEDAITQAQAVQVAREARRIASDRGVPQDIEWAIDTEGTLWILQARPMTALPPEVSWESPARGAYTRQLRFGEWIAEPVTPLFESWLLIRLEEALHAKLRAEIGQHAPLPHHVIVNGWYFYSLNWFSASSLARSLPSMLAHLLREPRKLAGVMPLTVRFSVPLMERTWREDVQPRYRAEIAEANAQVESIPVAELPGFIDRLADLAGEYFMWIAALAGAAYKMEINLALSYRRSVAPILGGSHLPLLSGFEAPGEPGRHAVASIDWWYPVAPELGSATRPAEEHARLVATRKAAEEAAFAVLASSPRRLRAFQELLTQTQHLVPLREEQTAEWTMPWPAMRQAVLRIGQALADRGVIAQPEDVFFLTRTEALAALDGKAVRSVDVGARRSLRDEQARLVPPLRLGKVNRVLKMMWSTYPRWLGAVPSDGALVTGSPASPGRATGPVRIIRGPSEFGQLQQGDVLVAPLTAPAWTPLFTRAAAVVTDVGSPAAHASIIAREYGIPAVVGCGDATARLRTGMVVTVDGATGNVELA